jgi:adenylosuccinate synthase
MLPKKFNIVTDGQWGSCGKGLITTSLADKHRPEILTTTNMANAGHTAVNENGDKFIAKALPSAAILNKWIPEYNPFVVVGATAAFTIDQMLKEIKECEIGENTIIHERAGVITENHKNAETDLKSGTKHVASTMQGCGAFLADKIMRKPDIKLARDYKELLSFVKNISIPKFIDEEILNGNTVLHEGAQGFSLDINHGSHYPYCTSRGTTATQNMADMGVSFDKIGDIYLVIRPFPIRVGNVVENGETVGYSGDCYDDHHEISWEEVAAEANAPAEVMRGELTTVTKRLRRVFTFSDEQLKEAVLVNGATKIALNFANYIDWKCYGTNEVDQLSTKIMDFIKKIEDITGIPVTCVGTGPQNNHVITIT